MQLGVGPREPYRFDLVANIPSWASACSCFVIPAVLFVAHHCEIAIRLGLAPFASIFISVVVLIILLIAMALLWTAEERLGLILQSLSIFGSFLFGLYHHFLAVSPDHVLAASDCRGVAFVLTAYLLLITQGGG